MPKMTVSLAHAIVMEQTAYNVVQMIRTGKVTKANQKKLRDAYKREAQAIALRNRRGIWNA